MDSYQDDTNIQKWKPYKKEKGFGGGRIVLFWVYEMKNKIKKKIAAAGDRTRVTRVTGGNTYHYTTTTISCQFSFL